MTVRELADAVLQKPFAVIAELMKLRVMATVNQQLDFDTISAVARNFGYTATK
jgi:translation initiation factor IF-2